MAANHVRIQITGHSSGTVEIDGQKLNGVTGVRFEHELHDVVRVSVDIIARTADVEFTADT